MTRTSDEMARRFLDGELSAEEERAVLHRIADDPEARAMLRFDAELREVLTDDVRPSTVVPPGFTDRVMAAIEVRETARAASPAPSPATAGSAGGTATDRAANGREPGALGRIWGELVRPRTLVWRPAYAVAAAALLALATALALGPLTGGPGAGDPMVAEAGGEAPGAGAAGGPSLVAERTGALAEDRILVRFVFVDGAAESVAVAGDFSRWEPIPLTRRDANGRALWTGLIAVPRGEHRYMFVLDGERWVTDPFATAVRDDGFGNRNAILSL